MIKCGKRLKAIAGGVRHCVLRKGHKYHHKDYSGIRYGCDRRNYAADKPKPAQRIEEGDSK